MQLVQRQRQRGTALLEALLAFLVLSLGMLGLARVQTLLREAADLARQRSEAVRLAQQDIESSRAFVSLPSTPGVRSYEEIAAGEIDVTPANSNTRYTLKREVQTSVDLNVKALRITLSWIDRQGARQEVRFDTMIAAHDPAYSGALVLSER